VRESNISVIYISGPSTLLAGHTGVFTKTRKRCQYCKMKNIRTWKGCDVQSGFKCSQCNVYLCNIEFTNRNCFSMFHRMYEDKLKDKEWLGIYQPR